MQIQHVQVSDFLHFLLLSYFTVLTENIFQSLSYPNLFLWNNLNERDGNILKSFLPFILSIQLPIRLDSNNFKTLLRLDKLRLSFWTFLKKPFFIGFVGLLFGWGFLIYFLIVRCKFLNQEIPGYQMWSFNSEVKYTTPPCGPNLTFYLPFTAAAKPTQLHLDF